MQQTIKVGVNGASGKMGQRVVALTQSDPELTLAATLESSTCAFLGKDAGEVAGIGNIGLKIASTLEVPLDVVIDFSTPDGLASIAKICGEREIALVAATTGLSDEQREIVLAAAHTTPVVLAPNMSLAVNFTMMLAQRAAEGLKGYPEGVDVEILERHHRFKADAPSGTALKFGEIVAEGMGLTKHIHGRQGRPGARTREEIGYHAIRTGDTVGEHTIIFGMLGESIELTVRGNTRDSYVYGALAAAKFLVTKSAGLYTMAEVLGID